MNADGFRKELRGQILRATQQGRLHVEINAGELHRAIGGYPTKDGTPHAMPTCCDAMRSEFRDGYDSIVHEPPKGRGAALTIRYQLPR
jgi:5-methylcytosine-specific restriction protein A